MAATAAARRASTRPRSAAVAPRRAPTRKPARHVSRDTGSTRSAPTSSRRPRPRSRGITPPAGFAIPVAVGQRTAVAVGGLADSGLVFRLTRGRLWILLLAALLAGIVALNVLSLSFSASASRTARQADAIERDNSILRARLAADVSSDQVQARGERSGLFIPAPGAIGYRRASEEDAKVAAERLLNGELTAAVAPEAPPPVEPVAPVTDPAVAPVATETVVPTAPAPTTTAPAP
jgi:hypothetical protein